jgi:hypothetical protein
MGCKGVRDASHFSAGRLTLQDVEASPFRAGRETGPGNCL